MRIEFEFSRTPEYFRKQLRAGALRALRPVVVLAVVLAGGGVATVLLGQGEIGPTLAGGFAVVMVVPLALRARRAYTRAVTVPQAWQGLRAYRVSEAGLASSTEHTSSQWGWEVVRGVSERPEAYLFRQDGPVVFDLPREPLSAEQEAELHAFLAGRGLTPTRAN